MVKRKICEGHHAPGDMANPPKIAKNTSLASTCTFDAIDSLIVEVETLLAEEPILIASDVPPKDVVPVTIVNSITNKPFKLHPFFAPSCQIRSETSLLPQPVSPASLTIGPSLPVHNLISSDDVPNPITICNNQFVSLPPPVAIDTGSDTTIPRAHMAPNAQIPTSNKGTVIPTEEVWSSLCLLKTEVAKLKELVLGLKEDLNSIHCILKVSLLPKSPNFPNVLPSIPSFNSHPGSGLPPQASKGSCLQSSVCTPVPGCPIPLVARGANKLPSRSAISSPVIPEDASSLSFKPTRTSVDNCLSHRNTTVGGIGGPDLSSPHKLHYVHPSRRVIYLTNVPRLAKHRWEHPCALHNKVLYHFRHQRKCLNIISQDILGTRRLPCSDSDVDTIEVCLARPELVEELIDLELRIQSFSIPVPSTKIGIKLHFPFSNTSITVTSPAVGSLATIPTPDCLSDID